MISVWLELVLLHVYTQCKFNGHGELGGVETEDSDGGFLPEEEDEGREG